MTYFRFINKRRVGEIFQGFCKLYVATDRHWLQKHLAMRHSKPPGSGQKAKLMSDKFIKDAVRALLLLLKKKSD